MKRKKLPKKLDRRIFKRMAEKTKALNHLQNIPRGGIRL